MCLRSASRGKVEGGRGRGGVNSALEILLCSYRYPKSGAITAVRNKIVQNMRDVEVQATSAPLASGSATLPPPSVSASALAFSVAASALAFSNAAALSLKNEFVGSTYGQGGQGQGSLGSGLRSGASAMELSGVHYAPCCGTPACVCLRVFTFIEAMALAASSPAAAWP